METIDYYTKLAAEDLRLIPENMTDFGMKLGYKRIKWGRYLFDEEQVLSQLENDMAEKYTERFKFYSYDYEIALDKKNIDLYVKGDKEYLEAKHKYQTQNTKVKFIQGVLDSLSGMSFVMNTVQKHLEYEAGV